jgi:hypothetical protein
LARFIEPMLLRRTDCLPSGAPRLYELKLDGYRAIAFTREGTVNLRSRATAATRDNCAVGKALAHLRERRRKHEGRERNGRGDDLSLLSQS